ncbi:hypothetical protein [Brevundimonas sp.]|uniref:hypothetical protein n=1 Tax=Brevundimonas sp. TaxID=1871086 RepID=UPI003F70B5CC
MRKLAFLASFALAAVLAGSASADPAAINVSFGPRLQAQLSQLGPTEVQEQSDRLVEVLSRELADNAALDGARIDLVLTDLKPNRPTRHQSRDRPGLDPINSVSIGGAAFEGQVTLADGTVQPVRYESFSNNLGEVFGFSTWQDADRAYRRLASNLAAGRYTR